MNRLLALMFVLLALPAALLFSRTTPPFEAPDEILHYFYARAVSKGDFIPHAVPGGVGGTIPVADVELARMFYAFPPFSPERRVTRALIEESEKLASDGQMIDVAYTGAANYPPLAYLAPATGLVIADTLGLSPVDAFFLGRSGNVVFVVAAIAAAILLLPVNAGALAFVFLLPMALYQTGSYSADAFVFAIVALACAVMARAALRMESPPASAQLVAAGLLVVLAAITKPSMIALVIPFAAVAAMRSKGSAILGTLAILACFAVWTFAFIATDAQAERTAPWGASMSGQLAYLLQNPAQILFIAANTLSSNWEYYVKGLVGVFGWLDTFPSNWFYTATNAVMAIIVMLSLFGGRHLPPMISLAFAASAVLGAGLTFGSLYVAWSTVGAPVVSGVQGRYFLPLLPPLFLACAGYLPRLRGVEYATFALLFVYSAVTVTHVTGVLVERFYVGP